MDLWYHNDKRSADDEKISGSCEEKDRLADRKTLICWFSSVSGVQMNMHAYAGWKDLNSGRG